MLLLCVYALRYCVRIHQCTYINYMCTEFLQLFTNRLYHTNNIILIIIYTRAERRNRYLLLRLYYIIVLIADGNGRFLGFDEILLMLQVRRMRISSAALPCLKYLTIGS